MQLLQLLHPQELAVETPLPQPPQKIRRRRIIQIHPQSPPPMILPVLVPTPQPHPQLSLQPQLLPLPQNNKRRMIIQQLLLPQLEKHPIWKPPKCYLQCYSMWIGLSWLRFASNIFTIFSHVIQKDFLNRVYNFLRKSGTMECKLLLFIYYRMVCYFYSAYSVRNIFRMASNFGNK